MSADKSKYHISIASHDAKNFKVLSFTGVDAIGSLYRFDVEFKLSGDAKTAPDASVLGEPCRLDIDHNGETVSYCGMVTEFCVLDSDAVTVEAAEAAVLSRVHYAISFAPQMYALALERRSRIFQRSPIPKIIKEVIAQAKLDKYFEYILDDSNAVKYPEREFCVQHQESDLDFISRLMEESGIWYWFKPKPNGDGTVNECVVVTDDFSQFPQLGRNLPFMKGSGFSEAGASESVNTLSLKNTLLPESVHVRAYNHRTPQSIPDGSGTVADGKIGSVYEFGGHAKHNPEADNCAKLCADRLWTENQHTHGKSNCASLKAGLQVTINHKDYAALDGTYLILSVKHIGGWSNEAYSYRNEFTCVRAEPKIYAPPLRTPVPRIDGVVTAPVGATGSKIPTLNEHGYYNVKMPFDLRPTDPQNPDIDYDRSKNIRVAQPSGGVSVDGDSKKLYGFHFPSKQGAEMVLAYVDGNPDKPVGLGFVPNIAAPSLVNNVNNQLNVIRTWGGNVLIMDDAFSSQKIVLSTAGNNHLDIYGNRGIEIGTTPVNNELLLDNENNAATLRALKHKIVLSYSEKDNAIVITTEADNSITLDDQNECVTVRTKNGNKIDMNDAEQFFELRTTNGNFIQMNDADDIVTVQSSNTDNKVVVNGNDNSISLDSMGNMVTVNGKDEKITVECKDCKMAIDGKGKKIAMESGGNKVTLDGGGNSVMLDVQKDITLKAGGKVIIDAKGGIQDKSPMLDMEN